MKSKKRILAVDFGLKRIGLAISDENQLIATALPLLQTEKTFEKTVEKLLSQIKEFELERILIGNPLHLNGNRSQLNQEIDLFIEALKKRTSIPILLWDERLTTAQADRLLKEGNLNRKRRSQHLDSLAALLLLQSYLG
jgi:putative holliday junction resolvase